MSRSSIVRNTKRALLATALVGALLALPAASQSSKLPKTQLWMDVATHTMSGIPGMSETGGGVGGFAMRMMGGDAAQNAAIVRDILEGKKSAARNVVLLNAGAALLVAGTVGSVREGIARAASAIDGGAAKATLDKMVRSSREEAVA